MQRFIINHIIENGSTRTKFFTRTEFTFYWFRYIFQYHNTLICKNEYSLKKGISLRKVWLLFFIFWVLNNLSDNLIYVNLWLHNYSKLFILRKTFNWINILSQICIHIFLEFDSVIGIISSCNDFLKKRLSYILLIDCHWLHDILHNFKFHFAFAKAHYFTHCIFYPFNWTYVFILNIFFHLVPEIVISLSIFYIIIFFFLWFICL